ncbi:MAG: hypothetical protein V4507_10460 [Verrucomicrobiota bacterium]
MNKKDIQQIRIDLEFGAESVLSMMFHQDGALGRSGNGSLPRDGIACLGASDGSTFRTLMDSLNESVFSHAGIYEMAEKKGTLVRYVVLFIGSQNQVLKGYDFRVGFENRGESNLLAYFDGFIQQAVSLTEEWYREALEKQKKEKSI